MEFKLKPISINRTSIETGLWAIQRYLMQRYGVDQSSQDIAPLEWYIYTDRASIDFTRAVLTAKPFMIGRKLHEGGSYDEVIERVKAYLNIQ